MSIYLANISRGSVPFLAALQLQAVCVAALLAWKQVELVVCLQPRSNRRLIPCYLLTHQAEGIHEHCRSAALLRLKFAGCRACKRQQQPEVPQSSWPSQVVELACSLRSSKLPSQTPPLLRSCAAFLLLTCDPAASYPGRSLAVPQPPCRGCGLKISNFQRFLRVPSTGFTQQLRSISASGNLQLDAAPAGTKHFQQSGMQAHDAGRPS